MFISKYVIFYENKSYFKDQETTKNSYTVDQHTSVLPQPYDLENIDNIKNMKNIEKIEDDNLEDEEQNHNEDEKIIEVRRSTKVHNYLQDLEIILHTIPY